MIDFETHHLGFIIEPEPGNPLEIEGVLNPAAARGPDGDLYLFPRIVAKGNFSRVGRMKVHFNDHGDPATVERLGVALEPTAEYELRPDGGGCEDPRVTYIDALGRYVMTYTAFSPRGPRIAVATSEDLVTWDRHGEADFLPHGGLSLDNDDNKDAAFFPEPIPCPCGERRFAMLHRPLTKGTLPADLEVQGPERTVDPGKESIWISWSTADPKSGSPAGLATFDHHHQLAVPVNDWEWLKIGTGAPPVLTPHGWLLVYHGVQSHVQLSTGVRHFVYSAGVMVLAEADPLRIEYRSAFPVLSPQMSAAIRAVPADVVFPTGLDPRTDLGRPDRIDVYFGMNDYRFVGASLLVPTVLPASGPRPA